jgi:hypothetical protein
MNPIPNPIRVNTGDQYKVSKTIDDFFVETKVFIEKTYNVKKLGFEIRSGGIAYNNFQVTDDRVTYLSYRDMVLACVFETRTEFNYVQYTFFRNIERFGELTSKK